MSRFRILTRGLSQIQCIHGIQSLGGLISPNVVTRHNPNLKCTTGVRLSSSYEASGKTTAIIMNKNCDSLCVEEMSTSGFKITPGFEILGSTIIFPNSLLSWHVSHVREINEDSFVLFDVLDPPIEILVFGYGGRNDFTPEIRERFVNICKKLKIRYEALPTHQACGVFNILSLEKRWVAGALIPPRDVDIIRLNRKKLEENKRLQELLQGDEDEVFLENKSKIEKFLK